jgi:hypothetical protein
MIWCPLSEKHISERLFSEKKCAKDTTAKRFSPSPSLFVHTLIKENSFAELPFALFFSLKIFAQKPFAHLLPGRPVSLGNRES